MLRIYIALCWLLVATVAHGAPPPAMVVNDLITKGPWVDVRAVPGGNLSAAAAYAIANNKPLHITSIVAITADTDLSAVPEIDIIQGGGFDVATGKALQLPVNFHAGKTRVFWGSGTKAVPYKTCPEWWGAVGDDTTDDHVALQAAVNSLGAIGGKVVVSGKYYLGTTTLTIAQGNITLMGLNHPVLQSGGAGAGDGISSIRYGGTGTAIIIGTIAAGVPGGYIYGVCVENIRIQVAESTFTAIAMYGPAYGYMRNVSIFGNSGIANRGIKIYGGMHYLFEFVELSGIGSQTKALPSDNLATKKSRGGNYLGTGVELAARGSSPDWDTTTITFNKCYMHYCQTDFLINQGQYASIIDTVFEWSLKGLITYGETDIRNPWFEQTATGAVSFHDGSITNITGGRIDTVDAEGTFHGEGNFTLTIIGSDITSTLAVPYLFPVPTPISGKIGISGVKFGGYVPAAWRICGTSGTDVIGSDIIKFTGMQIETYRFVQPNVTANLDQYPVNRDISAFTSVTAKEAGNIVGLNAYYSDTITAGTYTVDVLINGSGGYMQKTGNTGPLSYNHDYLSARFNKGDIITTHLITSYSPLFAPTGGTMIIEVVVAYGKDGKP